ncbi:ankyrin repeat and LEM domain-containing protein 1 isoform X2 [Grus americana]|uniref:ankyrin repeat and LEM domain-containing protein 1 isoform X2 n=1 Tax=Grus americana TaxID=9117 RepID=UPI002408757B|nr:ankyrin repeat and LEM domain-containing protein 1 isoform X2 [Grus americana]
MSGAGRREPCTEELLSRVAASRGCCRCLELLLEKGGDPEPRDQHGERDGDVVLGRVLILRDLAHAWGWPPAEDPGGPWRSLSFLTEDGTQGSVCPGDGAEGGLLSSTRRSLLEELELGGGCSSGEPLHWWGCPPEPPSLSIPSVAPRPPADPGGSALPPQPLASSTLLSAGDELGEGPQTARGSTGGPPGGVPEPSAGDSPGPSPQQEFGPGGSPSSPQPRCYSRVPGARGVSPRAPLLRGGLSNCSVACQSPGDSDVLGAAAQHRPGVPQGPPVGWAGLGGDIPNLGTTVLEVGAGGCDRSSLGDSSGASERFVSAVETLEPSEAGGCPGAQHRRSPQPRAAGGLEPGRAPSPAGAAAWELPPASPPNTGQVQGEDFWGGSRAAPCCEDGSDVGDGGELLSRLQACSLRGSPPCTPGPLCSPASLAAGGVAPQGQEPPRYHHVTPRTKSRLQASAARLSASSSSSLFDETLEMPRRPPRLRAPRGVSRDPATTLGHCITLGAKDVSGGAREGTASLDDTEIFPRAPSQPSSPLGTSSSPGSSPTVLLVPGDHGHPQDSPLGAQGSPCAAGSPNPRVLEGCSGWQDPSPLGTRQPPWPHGSFSRPPVPRQLGSAMAEPGSPAVPLSPAGRSTHRHAGEHLEEGERGRAPTERHGPGTEATTSPEDAAIQDGRACTAPPRPVSDEALRRRLRALGDDPGPVTELTRRLYLRRLEELDTALSWRLRCGPATSPTVPRTSWRWPGSLTAPTGAGAGERGWSSPASTTSSSTPEPAASLPPPEPGQVLQDLRQSHLLRGQGDACPAVLPPCRGAEPAPRRDAEGLPQGAAHPGDLGERAGRDLRALLPEHRPGGGLHAGGLPRGGSGAADHHEPEEGELLRRGGELAGGAAPAPGRPYAAQGHAHLPGRGRAAAPAGGHPGRALSTLGCWGAPPACTFPLPCPWRWPRSGRGFYVVITGENFSIFLFS